MLRAAALTRRPPGLCSRPRLAVAGRMPLHNSCAGTGTAAGQKQPAASSSSPASDLPEGIEALIRAIHADDTKAVVFVAGGASQALAWLLGVPGASNTVLEAVAPYSRLSLAAAVGRADIDQFCSAATAAEMARAAYRRAAALAPFGSPVVGAAATCALASEPPKRGAHRAWAAAHDGERTWVAGATFAKGARSRWAEDAAASRLLLCVLARASGVAVKGTSGGSTSGSGANGSSSSSSAWAHFIGLRLAPPANGGSAPINGSSGGGGGNLTSHTNGASSNTSSGSSGAGAGGAAGSTADPPRQQQQYDELDDRPPSDEVPDPLAALHAGGSGGGGNVGGAAIRCVEFSGGRSFVDAPRPRRVYLPGSFNPLHGGHKQLLLAACAAAGAPPEDGCFELAIENADKGVLPLGDARARVAQFVSAGLPVVATRAPLYVDKAALFSHSVFVVGYDTAARLVLPKYYGDSFARMLSEFSKLRAAGCRFLVAGRASDTPGTATSAASAATVTSDAAATQLSSSSSSGGRFLTLADVAVPPELADLFAAIPESAFRADVSSTALRAAGRGVARAGRGGG